LFGGGGGELELVPWKGREM